MTPSNAAVLAPSALAARLSYAGLAPFLLGAILAWLLGQEAYLPAHAYVMAGLTGYAATVASFLGAVHWGLAMRQGERGGADRWSDTWVWVWGVTPALVSWVALLMAPYAGLVVQGALLLACYGVDRFRYPQVGLSGWLTLRFRCTVLAALCCFLAAAGT